MVDKGNHRHFMAKEIHEQPEVIVAHAGPLSRFRRTAASPRLELPFDFADARPDGDLRLRHGLSTPAWSANTGSSALRGCRSTSMSPREFRYREMPLPKSGLALFVSQSGETADTLAVAALLQGAGPAHRRRSSTCATSTIARESRRRAPDACRPGDRRRLHQGVHLPAYRACLPRRRRRRARAARCRDEGARRLVQALIEAPRLPAEALKLRRRRSRASRRISPRSRTCSISAAAPTIRWRWKAR